MSSDAASRPQGLVARYLATGDRNATRLFKLISTTSGFDTFLQTTTYTLHFLHAGLERATDARLQAAANALMDRLTTTAPDALLPGETLIATIETPPNSRLLRAEQSTKALTSVIDEMRMFMRLRGLLSMWMWGAGVLRKPNADPLLQAIAVTQVIACTGYQALENIAYLATKGVIGLEPKKIGRAFIWSVRCWMFHVALDFVRLYRVRQLRKSRSVVEGEEKVRKTEEETWWRELRVNMAWAPLTVHWSLEKGFANEATIATLAGFAAWTDMLRQWKATA